MLMLTQSDLVSENSLLRTSASSLDELIANVAETLGIATSAAHVLCELDSAGRVRHKVVVPNSPAFTERSATMLCTSGGTCRTSRRPGTAWSGR